MILRKVLLPLQLLVFLCAFAGFDEVLAHETRSAYLEIKQSDIETYDIFWRVPARGNLRLGLYVELPETCKVINAKSGGIVEGISIERWSIQCPGSLTDKEISIRGLSSTLTDVFVRVVRLDGKVQTLRLSPDRTTFKVEASPSVMQIAWSYLQIGVEHILLGVDHLLFVFGLLLLVQGRWNLLKTITAFTIAHSLTLILATLGIVYLPPEPLNAVIALSILFLGPEIINSLRGRQSFTTRCPWLVSFLFGLLHGFGFASGLSEIGVEGTELVFGLLMFNVGVEIGQIAFVLIVLAFMDALKTLEFSWPAWTRFIPAYIIGTMGAFWTFERLWMLITEVSGRA